MTLHEVTDQIFSLSLGHIINSEKFSKQRLEKQIVMLTRPETGSNWYIFEICLPDGKWMAEVTQFRAGEFDYYIPDTREQEAFLWDKLLHNNAGH